MDLIFTIMRLKLILFIMLSLGINSGMFAQSGITQVNSFGTNPGNLNMYTHIPNGISSAAPLVIAMHGCTQNASTYAIQSGWNKLADRHKFYVVYPEQLSANNSSLCFNWFDTMDVNKNQGEALSVKQMVDYMTSHYAIDASKIMVTGLSAGGAMTVVMLATYPQTFNKGAVMAGLPYKAATSSFASISAMNGSIIKSAQQWGDLVRMQNPGYTNPYPHLAIFHGTLDYTVNINNATELIKQWTNLNNADQTADSTINSFQGNAAIVKTVYNDNLNNPVVYYYKITGMGHAIAVDTGSCPRKGGATGTYATKENNFHSTYWAADFFGILTNPYSINGAISLSANSSNIVYIIPNVAGSSFVWTVPDGAIIVSGQGTNTITVNFGTTSGNITVTETTTGNCVNDIAKLFVTITTQTSIKSNTSKDSNIYFSKNDNSIITNGIDLKELKTLKIYSVNGQEINQNYSVQGNKIILSFTLKTGFYIITLSNSEEVYSAKFIVL